MVHIDHGIGRFRGLKTIEAAGAPHDCLEILYADNNRVYLPVENIELLSRYGSEETDVPLDRLGGVAWQHRRARMKQRLREMAAQLIKIAAARATKSAPVLARARRLVRRVRRALPLRGDRGPGRGHRRGPGRPHRRQADGPADLRRRRLRQDRGRAARRVCRGDGRQAGRGDRADDAAWRASTPRPSANALPASPSGPRRPRGSFRRRSSPP